jgi:hypothetical protein
VLSVRSIHDAVAAQVLPRLAGARRLRHGKTRDEHNHTSRRVVQRPRYVINQDIAGRIWPELLMRPLFGSQVAPLT